MNISEQTANDLCLGAIQRTDLYEICLNYTGNDTAHYVTSCVEDIKVTVFVCRNVMCLVITTFQCVLLLTHILSPTLDHQ